jgi:ABC-type uncharacterized transport system auxiliary subunit
MRGVRQLLIVAVCLAVTLSGCASGSQLSLGKVESVRLSTIPEKLSRQASQAETRRVVDAFESAKVLRGAGESTPGARIDVVLASGDTVVVWGGAGCPLVVEMRGRQFNVESHELSQILDDLIEEANASS